MSDISKIDKCISEGKLKNSGLSVENIVATLDLGQEFDLSSLAEFLDDSEYEPETTPFTIWRPSGFNGTVLIPTNGMASLVGCKSKNGLIRLANHLISKLSEIAPQKLPSPSKLEIQNIVVQGDLDAELELTEITLLLGLENTEYEPEQFPGVIYRTSQNNTVLIFSSGKFMVNGAESYDESLETVKRLVNQLDTVGLQINTESINDSK